MKTSTFCLVFLLACFCPVAQAQTAIRSLPPVNHKYYYAKSSYPVLRGESPLARLADTTLEHWAQTQQSQFVSQARHDFAHGAAQYAPNGYGYEVSVAYRYARPFRLFSVCLEQYEDTGGAHPNTFRFTFNFGLVHGRPQRLTLGDFFTPESDYRTRVQSLLLARLHKDSRAAFIGQYRALTAAQLNHFVVERGGLRFYFDPYEVGPYAAGPIDVMLTAAELGPDFRGGVGVKG